MWNTNSRQINKLNQLIGIINNNSTKKKNDADDLKKRRVRGSRLFIRDKNKN